MDQPVAFFTCTELLHAAARSGSATACHLHRLAAAQNVGRYRRRRILCHSIDFYSVGPEFCLRGLWKSAVDRRHFLWTQTGGDGDRRRRRDSHRAKSTEKRSDVDARRARFCRDLLFQNAISVDYFERRSDRTDRRSFLEI